MKKFNFMTVKREMSSRGTGVFKSHYSTPQSPMNWARLEGSVIEAGPIVGMTALLVKSAWVWDGL